MSAPPLEAWPRPFGRYTLLAPLAQGGMGDVCIALAGTVSGAERLCVLKTIRADLAGDKEFLNRFLDEGRVVCALTHPNIAQVMEVGTEESVPYLAMEFVAGEDLDRVIQAAQRINMPLPVDFVVTVIAGVLEGLSYAHRATALDGRQLQIVHRDISPQNVRVGWDGDVKILDFGTARAAVRQTQTVHGVVFGKPGYMSPEQARGEQLDGRTDLFALGVVTWELFAGAELARQDTAKYMQQVASGELHLGALCGTRTDMPPALDEWIEKITHYDKRGRFPDAATARRTLMDIARDHKIRVEREAVVETLNVLLDQERESSKSYVTALVARGRATRESLPGKPADTTGARRAAAAAPVAPKPDEPGVIGGTRYRAGELLGSGGMGEVFAAEHADLGRKVALKLLYPEHSYNPSIAQRFRMEARAIASLSHPNLVQVFDFGETSDGRLFYAMERLEGDTLRGRIDTVKRLEAREAVRIGAAVARGLATAHAAGVIHRDLKPENVFLTREGGIKLLDFGVAKATDSSTLGGKYNTRSLAGEVFGSPGYISPEQGTGKAVDARTDVYSLGAVLYEALTGSRVFEGETMVEVLARHLAEAPKPFAERAPDAKIPEALEALVMECLAKDPAKRPQAAAEVAEKLEAIGAQLERENVRSTTRITASVPPPSGVDAADRVAGRTSSSSTAPAVVSTGSIAGHDEPVELPVNGSGRSRVLIGGAVVVALLCAGTALWVTHSSSPVAASTTPAENTVTHAGTADTGVGPATGGTMPATALAGNTAGNAGGSEPTNPAHVAPPPPTNAVVDPVQPGAATTASNSGSHSHSESSHHGVGGSAQHDAHAHPGTTGATAAVNATATNPATTTAAVAAPPPSHFAQAQTALNGRQYDQAISEANASIAAHDHVVDARNLLGLAYLRQGRRDQAVAQWRLVLARDPSNTRARELLRAAGENPDQP